MAKQKALDYVTKDKSGCVCLWAIDKNPENFREDEKGDWVLEDYGPDEIGLEDRVDPIGKAMAKLARRKAPVAIRVTVEKVDQPEA